MILRTLRSLLSGVGRSAQTDMGPARGPVDHVIIIDGTMSTLEPGHETNAGLAYRLMCCDVGGRRRSIWYEDGIQWLGWRSTYDVLAGRGINRQIRRVYGYLASRYKPGDRIFLIGYSRGAYAVRSLAGVIDRVGLVRSEYATQRNVVQAYRHYECRTLTDSSRQFSGRFCHDHVPIEFIGVWDTVKALGIRFPFMWESTKRRHSFHNHELSSIVKHGFQALALHETRRAYAPVLWDCSGDFKGHVEQIWFRGTHGDVGGQLNGFFRARPLSNIAYVWLMEQAQTCGLDFPEGWQDDYLRDDSAPSVGRFHGWAKFFLSRRKRVPCTDPSERVHPSVPNAESYCDVLTDAGDWCATDDMGTHEEAQQSS